MKKTTQESNDTSVNLNEAILVNLKSSSFGNFRKVPIEKLGKGLSKRLRASKELVDKSIFEEINSVFAKIRTTVISYSLPFPIDGFYLCPKASVMKLCEELDALIEKVPGILDNLQETYTEGIEEAKEELGIEFFNQEDYPPNIRDKFKISYRLLDLKPSEGVKEFDPKLYKEEENKFKNMMEETRNECITFLRQGFLQVLQSVTDSVTNKQRIRQDSVDKIEKFFNEFNTKNIFQDKQLENVLKEARNVMFGVSAEDIRNSEALKEKIQKEIKTVTESLQEVMEIKPRKITLKKIKK